MSLRTIIDATAQSNASFLALVEAEDYPAIATYLNQPGELIPNPEPQQTVTLPLTPERLLAKIPSNEWAALFGLGTFTSWAATVLGDPSALESAKTSIRTIGMAIASSTTAGDRSFLQVATELIGSGNTLLVEELISALLDVELISTSTYDDLAAVLTETGPDPTWKAEILADSIAEANGLGHVTSIAVQGAMNEP